MTTAHTPQTAHTAQKAKSPIVETRNMNVIHKTRTGKLFRPDTVHANKDVNFHVHRGEVVGIVGESGCGKSTLARVLVGLQKPTSGEVYFNGQLMRGGARQRKELGRTVSVVFQDPATALNPRMTVKEQLLDPLHVHHVGDEKSRMKRVQVLLSLVGLPQSALDVLPRQISGGQRQRVAIARALALEPDLIIADEPTSALDVSVRAQVLNLLTDLRSELGLGLVFISHDINTVRYVSDRMCVMLKGEIIEEQPTEQLFSNPQQEYTRTLLAATPTLI
ncbi:ATP-binding cassette domain-containing protein [Corynebacterium sp. 153RC1]|uniref:ABC transporter ATP-binding protein n=2 Tax=unclassified Corynebacterium TaxID=2624378 RepID=UPI00211BBEDB|nr:MULTISPECIES: ATP-binding cassette domain-containing protein [unclassified Corynebacterium]MCQ9351803.1 ATP-binding cassette domain-containing protein [Corynebacterium sp. 209RC1]MCQ9354539.1 ATP-binding cassette domain-containing protein [Corynebacterium sp. 1222RC1]MCQ9356085.1 ATP-binding cassette domain-containing protein [Corynebacterium sp. 122RC1]MCQ9358717.1 ATP-binding cassette domain-containing protein [Corynebacterium sp. 142RC1]MCQ9360699.1 ATP-binding cassette domain-containing